MTSSRPVLPPSDSGGESMQGMAARMLTSCLVAVEDFLEGAVEQACREHPERAEAIRARMREVRAAGLAARVNHRSTSQSASWAEAPTLQNGETTEHFEPIGPYQPLKELGRGGQALVYLAEDLRLHRPVALKILRGFGPLSEDVMRRFRREAEVASKLDHPGICAVYDAGVERGIPFIAMRYVEGESLAAKIAGARTNGTRAGRSDGSRAAAPNGARSFAAVSSSELAETETTPPTEATTLPTGQNTRVELLRVVRLIEKAARALHAAHEAGIVHRDVKPGNILVTPSAEPVLLDFGLAGEVAGELSAFTRTGELFGTPAYMSPEQLLAKRIRLDRRTDVYSLGATLYECVTLRRPFEAPTREALYHAIQFKDPPNPRKLNPLVPPDLKVVLEKALEKDRDRRYPTAEAFADDLQRVRTGEPIAARPVGRAGRAVRWARRRPFHAAVLLTLLIGLPLVTGLGAYVIRSLPDIRTARDRARAEEIERLLEQGFSELTEHDDKTAYDRAITLFDEALRLDPDCVEAIVGEAVARYTQRRYDECMALLDRYRKLEAELLVLRRLRALASSQPGRAPDGEEALRMLSSPSSPLDQFLAGLTLMRRCGQQHNKEIFRHAADHLTRAVFLSARFRPMYLGELAHAIGHLEEAAIAESPLVAHALRTACPESAFSCFRAGHALGGVDPAAAIGAYQRGLQLKPASPHAHVAIGRLYGALGDESKQLFHYETALRLNPRAAYAYCLLGIYMHNKRRNFERAISLFQRAIELDDSQAIYYANLAVALNTAGRLAEAMAACEEALRCDDESAMVHLVQAVVLLQLGSVDDAIAALRKAIEHDATVADAHHQLGIILHNRKREYDAAITHFLEAIRLKSDVALYHANLGNAYLSRGDFDPAIRAFRAAIELERNEDTLSEKSGRTFMRWRFDVGLTYMRLGVALARSGRLEEAIDTLEHAAERYPDHAQVRAGLALILADFARDLPEALALQRRAIELEAGNPLHRANLAVDLANLGRYDEALAAGWQALGLAEQDRSRGRERNCYAACEALGELLCAVGHPDQAREVLESGLSLPEEPPSGRYCGILARALMALARYDESLAMLRSAREKGPGPSAPDDGWSAALNERIRIAERRVELEGRMEEVLRGDEQPENAEDWALLAVILRARQEHATAARFFAVAFARDAAVAVPVKELHRYRMDAARAAVLAGSGPGTSGAALTLTERAELSRQALRWLEEELTYLVEDFIPPRDSVRASQPDRWAVLAELRRWQVHVDFADVRYVDGLGRLPAAERDAWIAFWQRIEAAVEMLDEKQQRPALPLFPPPP